LCFDEFGAIETLPVFAAKPRDYDSYNIGQGQTKCRTGALIGTTRLEGRRLTYYDHEGRRVDMGYHAAFKTGDGNN
jgi:hypothetical protein